MRIPGRRQRNGKRSVQEDFIHANRGANRRHANRRDLHINSLRSFRTNQGGLRGSAIERCEGKIDASLLEQVPPQQLCALVRLASTPAVPRGEALLRQRPPQMFYSSRSEERRVGKE